MDRTSINGVGIYYEVHGTGEPLLLIEGLGYATWMWFKQVPSFSRHFQTIIFDNRGAGWSDKPDLPYTAAMMAGDAAGLLSNLGISRAHVLGVSMGGFIAQELALSHPEMVSSLILCCTSFGGPDSVPMTAQALDSMLKVDGLSAGQAIRQGLAVAFSPGYMEEHPDEIEQITAWRLARPTPRYAWEHQFSAAREFCSENMLSNIRMPTLVLAGDRDVVLPPENACLLAGRITGAKLQLFSGGGHLFFIEQAEQFNRTVLNFLTGLMDEN